MAGADGTGDLHAVGPGDAVGRTSRAAMSALAHQPMDWIVRELCVFCYRHPMPT